MEGRYPGIVSRHGLLCECVFVSGECVCVCGGVLFQEMLHLQISFYGNPAMIAVAGIQLRDERAERKCASSVLCVVSVIDAALLPFLPPSTPPLLCV